LWSTEEEGLRIGEFLRLAMIAVLFVVPRHGRVIEPTKRRYTNDGDRSTPVRVFYRPIRIMLKVATALAVVSPVVRE